MIIRRPMRTRQITGAMFGEPAVLVVRTQGPRNKHGETSFSEQRTDITLATNPLSTQDKRMGDLQEGGIRLQDARVFFTVQEPKVDPQDYIIYQGETYIIHYTSRYGHYSESVGVRKEVQP